MEQGPTRHLVDYPPRRTACGLYYPKGLGKEYFGTYFEEEVTCKRCLRSIRKHKEELNELEKDS